MANKCGAVFMRIFLLLVFAATLAINYLAVKGNYPFIQPTANISHSLPTPITPDDLTFAIWSVIYLFLTITVLFAFATFFFSGPYSNQPLYLFPDLFSIPMLVCLVVNLVFNASWLLIWDHSLENPRVFLPLGAVFLLLSTGFVWASLGVSMHDSALAWPIYRKNGMSHVWWLTRLVVENGLAVYCAWTFIASNIAVVMPIIYASSPLNATTTTTPTQQTALLTDDSETLLFEPVVETSAITAAAALQHADLNTLATVVFAIIIALLAVWILLDAFLLNDRYTRYLITPGLTLLWVFLGIYRAHFTAATRTNQILIGMLLAEAAACILLKLILSFTAHRRNKIYRPL